MRITSLTGRGSINLVDPKPESICIDDIARALSRIPRFNGILPHAYTVAEHCIAMSVSMENSVPVVQLSDKAVWGLHGLIHDWHEAYLGDITRPVIKLLGISQKLEKFKKRFDDAIRTKFKIPVPTTEQKRVLNELDNAACDLEIVSLRDESNSRRYGSDHIPGMLHRRFMDLMTEAFGEKHVHELRISHEQGD